MYEEELTLFHETETLRSVSLFHDGEIGNDSDSNTDFVATNDDVSHFKAGNAVDTNINLLAGREQILLQLPVIM